MPVYKGDIENYLDLAAITGSEVVSERTGVRLGQDGIVGMAKTIEVGRSSSVITTIEPSDNVVSDRIELLKESLVDAETDFARSEIKDRIAILVGGIASIKVGGNSMTEKREIYDRVDDSLRAVKAAIEEGVVTGGGACLIHAASRINDKNVMSDVLLAPTTMIMKNAGYNNADISHCLRDISGEHAGVSFNINTGRAGVHSSVIDPAKVLRCAVENSASLATMILTTECAISNKTYND